MREERKVDAICVACCINNPNVASDKYMSRAVLQKISLNTNHKHKYLKCNHNSK